MVKLVAINEQGKRIGETHHRAKLSDADVDCILELRAAGLSFGAIASKWDAGVTISKSTVRDICTGRIRAQTPDSYRPRRQIPLGRLTGAMLRTIES